MDEERCPSCGEVLPREMALHAKTPSAGVVECPNCGATVTLDKAGAEPGESPAGEGEVTRATEGGWGEAGREESFSEHESVEGVMDELSEKEGGPE